MNLRIIGGFFRQTQCSAYYAQYSTASTGHRPSFASEGKAIQADLAQVHEHRFDGGDAPVVDGLAHERVDLALHRLSEGFGLAELATKEIVGRASGVIVAVALIEDRQIQLMVDQITEGVLEGAGENLVPK